MVLSSLGPQMRMEDIIIDSRAGVSRVYAKTIPVMT